MNIDQITNPTVRTREEVKAAIGIMFAVSETIREMGEVPSGHLYAAFSSKGLSISSYETVIRTLKNTGLVWDLLPFVMRHVYHPDFRGSFSIKSVLPALVPDMAYDGREVAEGSEAGLAWERMIRGDLDAAERQRLKAALLAYFR